MTTYNLITTRPRPIFWILRNIVKYSTTIKDSIAYFICTQVKKILDPSGEPAHNRRKRESFVKQSGDFNVLAGNWTKVCCRGA